MKQLSKRAISPPAGVRRKQRAVHLRSEIRHWITDGKLQPGDLLPGRREMARQFGVSLLTTHRALDELRRDGYVRADSTRGTYVAQRPPHLTRFGLLFPGTSLVDDRFQIIFYRALRDAANTLSQPGEFELVIYPYALVNRDSVEYHNLVADVRHHRLAGLILAFPAHLLAGSPLIDDPGMPRVAIGGQLPVELDTTVRMSLDFDEFYRRAFRHLIAAGRSRPAVLCMPRGQSDAVRAQEIARECGLELPPHRLLPVGSQNIWSAANLMGALLQFHPSERPDSLIIADDHLVEPATGFLADAGLRVPQDLLVITHCNFPQLVPAHVPVVRLGFDSQTLLQTACELVRQQRRGETPPHSTILPAIFEDEWQRSSRPTGAVTAAAATN